MYVFYPEPNSWLAEHGALVQQVAWSEIGVRVVGGGIAGKTAHHASDCIRITEDGGNRTECAISEEIVRVYELE